MKYTKILIATFLFFIVSCGKGAESSVESQQNIQQYTNKNCVELIYFHGDMRCRNCYAMEKGVAELLDENYADEVKKGEIVFKTIDITSPKSEKIADNYGVTWSSLFLNYWNDGKETRNDLTNMGMKTAAKDPVAFKAEVKSLIDKYLQ